MCPEAPPWTDMHLIWHSRSGRRHNHLWQIFWWSVEGCRFCGGSKIALSNWQSQWPLTQGWRYRAACDVDKINHVLYVLGYRLSNGGMTLAVQCQGHGTPVTKFKQCILCLKRDIILCQYYSAVHFLINIYKSIYRILYGKLCWTCHVSSLVVENALPWQLGLEFWQMHL